MPICRQRNVSSGFARCEAVDGSGRTAEEARITVLVDDFQLADSNPCGQDRQFGLLKRMAIEGDRLGFSSLLDVSALSRQWTATYCGTR